MPLRAFDPSTGLAVQVDVVPARPRAGQLVRWRFSVTNHTAAPRELTFASSQHGEIVLATGVEERYRWSAGKAFAAVLAVKTLQPEATWSFSIEELLVLEPGRYSLLATVAARPAPPPVRGEISVLDADEL